MKKIIVLIIGLVLSVNSITYGYGTRTTSLGGLYETDLETGSLKGIGIEWFRNYKFGTQTVYNDVGSTSATDGMLDVRGYQYGKTIAVNVGTVTAGGTLTVTVNEFIGTSSSSVVFNAYNYTGVGSGTTRIPLTDYCEYMSISVAASTSTGNMRATITGNFTELKTP